VTYADLPPLLSAADAARFLRVDPRDLHRGLLEGTIPAVLVDGEWHIFTRRLLMLMGADQSRDDLPADVLVDALPSYDPRCAGRPW
jgi:hypothetical protein